MTATLEIEISAERWARAQAGASCRYVVLEPNAAGQGALVGLKIYRRRSQAERIARRQYAAGKAGIAPAVFGPIVRVYVEGQDATRFGYLTEHCWGVESREAKRELIGLRRRIEAMGLEATDLRACNVGRTARGRWVVIDFDDYTWWTIA